MTKHKKSKAKAGSVPDAEKSKPEPAKWSVADETAFVAFLHEHRAAGGDSATFKMATFNEAAPLIDAVRIKARSKPELGGPKTGSSCQTKWAQVCKM